MSGMGVVNAAEEVAALDAQKSKLLAENTSDQGVSDRINIYIDNPTFRPIRVMVPFKNLNTSLDKAASQVAHQSLRRFSAHLGVMLSFTSLFQVSTLPVYAPPFFPWPLADQSLSEWLVNKPSVVLKNTQPVDVVVLVDVGYLEKTKQLTYKIHGVDLRSYSVRVEKEFSFVMGKQAAREKEWAFVFADAMLEAYTGRPGIFGAPLVFVGKKTKASPKHIYTARIDGSGLRQITWGPSIHLSPSWSKDGKHIIFTSYRSGDPDLYAYDLASQKVRLLAAYPGVDSGGQHDALSDNVVFSGRGKGDADIFVTSLEGKARRRTLIRGLGLDVSPTFSPDGRWLVYVSGRFGNPHIFRADLQRTAGKIRVIKDHRLTWAGWYNGSPAVSPDSKKIAFAGYDKETDRFDIFMMNMDGRSLERLTLHSGDNEGPSWSPNGHLMVFHSNRLPSSSGKGPTALYVMRRDGGLQKKIILPLYSAESPKWATTPIKW